MTMVFAPSPSERSLNATTVAASTIPTIAPMNIEVIRSTAGESRWRAAITLRYAKATKTRGIMIVVPVRLGLRPRYPGIERACVLFSVVVEYNTKSL